MTENDNAFETPNHEIDDLARDMLWAEVPAPHQNYWSDIQSRLSQVGHHENTDRVDSHDGAQLSVDRRVTDISPDTLRQQKSETEPSRRRLAFWPVAAAASLVVLALVFGSNGFGGDEIETGFADDDGIEQLVVDEAGVRAGATTDVLGPVVNVDHWHSVYGVWDCTAAGGEGGWVPPFQSTTDNSGIHSHGDGLIHIHPFFEWSAGENAQLWIFADEMGITLTDSTLELDDGQVLTEGTDCGGEPAVLHIRRWETDIELRFDPDAVPAIVTTNLSSERFLNDREVWTIALAPLDAQLPLPPQIRFDTLNTVTTPADFESYGPFASEDTFLLESRDEPIPVGAWSRPTAGEFFTIIGHRDSSPAQAETFTLLRGVSSEALTLVRYPLEGADDADQICVDPPRDGSTPICGDGSPTEGTSGNLAYVLVSDAPAAAAWMVVDLSDGTSLAANVAENLAYVEWPIAQGEATRTVLLDAELNEID